MLGDGVANRGPFSGWRRMNSFMRMRMNTGKRLVTILFVSSLPVLSVMTIRTTAITAQVQLKPTANPIPSAFFGMHIHHMVSGAPQPTPWPAIPFGSWRFWDAYAAWPNLEPEKGKWNFQFTDKYVDAAEAHHVQVLFPIALSPAWASARPQEKSAYSPGNAAEPKDINDWRNYVRTVATRYKGRVHAYEIWNEPNLKGFYSGSTAQLVQLASVAYQTLKEIDQENIICSPAFTGASGLPLFDQYLQAGGGKYADVIGYHLYVNPAPPEDMVPLTQQVEAVMSKHGVRNKQLWDTETGWAIQNTQSEVKPAPGKGFNSVVLSLDQASAYVARTYILAWAMDVSRLYWYSWDNKIMGLTEEDGKTLKPPAHAYAEVEKWLVGARMNSCASDASWTWTSEISRDGGYHGWLVWNPNQSLSFKIPPTWNPKLVRDLKGAQREIPPKGNIEIGPSPILLETGQ